MLAYFGYIIRRAASAQRSAWLTARTAAETTDVAQKAIANKPASSPPRQRHGLLAEWVIEPSDLSGDAIVITVWPSHEIFDLWIDTPDRDALTKSEVHQSVSYRPLRRYDLIDGYTNAEAFASLFGGPVARQEIEEE